MNNFKKYGSLLIFTLIFGTMGLYAQENEKDLIKEKDQKKLVTDTQYAKEDLMESNKNVAQLFEDAYAYVIFPNVGKGAFIAGGAAGSGIAFQGENQVGWSTLRQLDVGFQFGGKSFIQAIFFQDKQNFDEFKSGEFEFGAGVSAVALSKGASKNVNFEDGMAVVTLPKGGAMIEVSVGGQKFKYQGL